MFRLIPLNSFLLYLKNQEPCDFFDIPSKSHKINISVQKYLENTDNK